ncbi:isochorismatase family protein [Planomonospora sp. ID82291]|uniref:isochorismatase family protein n=1 Tax=Planomonospora sp. ID82291 TaxID=2738136 RepID=UPI0018C43DB0|nr:isochorismatase family protein [Planomonospora sp. ID82291]MBG0814676.1 isochorismatase family protein [Planomonospora sp. ID82291]
MRQVLLVFDARRSPLRTPAPGAGAAPDERSAADTIAVLLERARAAGAPVVFVRGDGSAGDPGRSGTPGGEPVHEALPGEHVIDGHAPDAFDGTDLAWVLPPVASVVVAGMRSERSVRETSLAALARGHAVTLVRGVRAACDGDEPAAVVSRRVEEELTAAGAMVATPYELF